MTCRKFLLGNTSCDWLPKPEQKLVKYMKDIISTVEPLYLHKVGTGRVDANREVMHLKRFCVGSRAHG